MSKPTIYVASAGTGKTTALMEELNHALEEATPDTVIFTTFTTAGAHEAASRAREKFPKYTDHQFRYFRTMHSLAYRSIPQKKMMTFTLYSELGKELGMNINSMRAISSKGNAIPPNTSDRLLQLNGHMRSRRWTFEEASKYQEDSTFSIAEIKDFDVAYRAFRKKHGVYDFTDQLEVFLELLDDWAVPITHLFVDECQDLSTLQWEIVRKLQSKAQKTIIAGDDKQSIYGFSGGDPKQLIDLEGDRKVLKQSYRLPENLLSYAETIADRISDKQDYSVAAADTGGLIEYIGEIAELADQMKEGTWFFLARNRKYLPYFEQQLNRLGLIYQSDTGNGAFSPQLVEAVIAWTDMRDGFTISSRVVKHIYKNYLKGKAVAYGFKKRVANLDDDTYLDRDVLQSEYGLLNFNPWYDTFSLPQSLVEPLKRMEETGDLNIDSKIRVATIHSVKGKEADNVVILPDMTSLTHKGYLKDPDSEHRVFYVGATRAKQQLFLHKPMTDYYYNL